MRSLLLALQFLTVIPIRTKVPPTLQELGRSAARFPLVGLLIGGVLVAASRSLSLIFPRLMVDALLLVLLTFLTGALHLDGFADTVDALAGGRSREERLAILADSRIGAVGAAGLILLILVKFAAIHSCPESLRDRALFLFPAVGRWNMVLLAWKGTYARDTGTGKAFVGNVRWPAVLVATLTVAGASGLLLGFRGFVIPAAVAFLGLLSFFYFRRRFGGITGDVLGAMNELGELFTLMMVSLNM